MGSDEGLEGGGSGDSSENNAAPKPPPSLEELQKAYEDKQESVRKLTRLLNGAGKDAPHRGELVNALAAITSSLNEARDAYVEAGGTVGEAPLPAPIGGDFPRFQNGTPEHVAAVNAARESVMAAYEGGSPLVAAGSARELPLEPSAGGSPSIENEAPFDPDARMSYRIAEGAVGNSSSGGEEPLYDLTAENFVQPSDDMDKAAFESETFELEDRNVVGAGAVVREDTTAASVEQRLGSAGALNNALSDERLPYGTTSVDDILRRE